MARKARQRISYVLPLANSRGGHRLGINGLAIDANNEILYSGGKDGLICSWRVGATGHGEANGRHGQGQKDQSAVTTAGQSVLQRQVQAHTHWINDICLVQSNSALISASSDITVKLWRPHSHDSRVPTTIGLHNDYVKCLASPGVHADWVASGGLDHSIRLWDLNRACEKLHIDVGDHGSGVKGSVYALSARGGLMASGGPENIVRLWDPRSGERVKVFVGHTDNVRDILISENGDTIMSASSDQTIKLWSLTAGRCMYTMTMHNDSVWELSSDHPRLEVFYSSDRSGLVAKTDVTGCDDMDDGQSLALAQEHEGVTSMAVANGSIWTATHSSSIHRWQDVRPELSRPRASSSKSSAFHERSNANDVSGGLQGRQLHTSPDSLLRISNSATLPQGWSRDEEFSQDYHASKSGTSSEILPEHDGQTVVPIRSSPIEIMEGQHGLIKHVMLNDRRRVLTLDTAGKVVLWDLLKCVPLKSFGNKHLDDIKEEIDTTESMANWCIADTRTGRLAVILEENYCFDAETYADQAGLEDLRHFREDQRINLGKWVLRNLFTGLIAEEVARDTAYRGKMLGATCSARETSRPDTLSSTAGISSNPELSSFGIEDDAVTASAAPNGPNAAPSSNASVDGVSDGTSQQTSANGSRQSGEDKYMAQQSPLRNSTENGPVNSPSSHTDHHDDPDPRATTSPTGTATLETLPLSSSHDGDKEEKTTGSFFTKKLKINFPKKLGRSSVEAKITATDGVVADTTATEEKAGETIEENLLGVIQKIRRGYEKDVSGAGSQGTLSALAPSPLTETPDLELPSYTTILIQEERPDSGGVADLYQGTVASQHQDADMIEKAAPMWLGDLLLRNTMPPKEMAKVSFVLLPYQDLLPSIASADGNTRLTANRMLRAKKILAYVAERIEPPPTEPDPVALRPEEYLDLYCQNQLISHNVTLATLRAHIWKAGGDVILYYKSNGKRPEIERLLSDKLAALSIEERKGKVGPTIHS